jgi:O-antigen/teichoic acid export membrane protein
LINWSVFVVTGFSFLLFCCFIAYLFSPWSTTIATQDILFWSVAFLILPMSAITHRGRGLMLGFSRPVEATLPEQLIRPTLALLLYVTVALFAELRPFSVLALFVGAYFVTVLFVNLQTIRATHWEVKHTQPAYSLKQWAVATMPLTGLAGLSIIKHQTDIIMLGALTTYADVGTYRIASQIASMAGMLMLVLNTVFSPKIAGGVTLEQGGKLFGQLVQSARAMFVFSLGFLILFFVFGEILVVLVFGEEFLEVYAYSLVLCVGVCFSAWCGQTATILKMTNNAEYAFRVSVEAAVLNVLLNYVLISVVGPIGAACGTTLSLVWVQWRQLNGVRKSLGISAHAFARVNSKSLTND